MAFDALSLSVLCDEFREALVGGKITKIYQPEKDEIVLFVFNRQTRRLVISANAGVNRIHLTEMSTENPKTAPSFCMLLRKHITNATVQEISQMPFERVLDFSLFVNDELGYQKKMHLVFELTVKTSNLILTDENYIVLDSIKHLPQDLESKRIIMPGAKYNFFLPQEKIEPFDLPRIREWLSTCNLPLRKTLPEVLLGVSQSTVNEILCGIDENDHTVVNNALVADRIAQYKFCLEHKAPNVVLQKGVPTDVCPFDYRSVKGEKLFFDTLNKAHDYFYFAADKVQRFNDKAKSVSTIVKNAISRTEKKLAAQRQSLLEAENREQYREFGDLILSNLWKIKQGAESFECANYFAASNEIVTIPLDKQLSPQQNAQAYYKKYRKLKSSAEHNTQLIEENQKMLEYLQTVRQNLKFCTETEDLKQIREELEESGLIKEGKSNGKISKQAKKSPSGSSDPKPLHYLIDGYDVYVGKNNLQNNFVTFRLARADDVWLHTQKIHSSHVVIVTKRNQPNKNLAENDETENAIDIEKSENGTSVGDNVIVTAAEICAFFSQSADGTKIPVDYTIRANVRKPTHSTPGFAVYNSYRTVLVNPNRHAELLQK